MLLCRIFTKANLLLLLLTIIYLYGCTSTSSSKNLSHGRPIGYVILSAYGNKDFSISFDLINHNTNKLASSSTYGSKVFEYKKSEGNNYRVIKMRAGDYVFKSLHYEQEEDGKIQNYILCMNDSTYQFTVEAERVIYLGELELQFPSKLMYTEGSLATANYTLKSLPKIKTKATKAELLPARFENGLDLFGQKASCGGI